ncbi:MAG: hypothetical protein ABWY05_09485 [Noviherbaspirillum sp.]
MAANPFKKESFPSFREWEQELVFFSVEQLHSPSYSAWESQAVDNASRECAAFLSHQLANVAYLKHLSAENELRPIYQRLMGKPINESDLRFWLARHWLDQSRFHATLDTALKNQLSRLTHVHVAA